MDACASMVILGSQIGLTSAGLHNVFRILKAMGQSMRKAIVTAKSSIYGTRMVKFVHMIA